MDQQVENSLGEMEVTADGIIFPGLGGESDDGPDVETDGQQDNRKGSVKLLVPMLNQIRSITVEPVLVLSTFVITMYSMLQKEYIYARISLDYNLTASERETSCNESIANKSDPNYILQQKVSSETSKWILYLYIADFSVALFSTILLGAWSDKVGRKIPLMMSCFGLFILMMVYVLVVNLNLPVPVLLIGHFICGLFGDLGNIFGCAFSHIADVSDKQNRTFRMAVLEASIGLGGFIASLSGGAWVQAQGFRQPFWFLLIICFINILYIGIRLDSAYEDTLLSNLRFIFTKQPFIHMYHVLKPQENDKERHINIIGYAIAFLIIVMASNGVRDLLVIYEIGLPFCWDFFLVGISLAISQLGYFVSAGLVKLFPSIKAEFWLTIIGAISNISSCIVLAFSKFTWMIFLGLILQLCFDLPAPIIRSQISRLVALKEVGFVLGLLSCAHNIGSLAASFIFNGVFAATVDSSLPGAAFLVGTGFFLLFIPLYWWVYGRSYGWAKNSESSTIAPYEKMVDEFVEL
ncbi:proton-coupled folate transporter-like [Styela clava]